MNKLQERLRFSITEVLCIYLHKYIYKYIHTYTYTAIYPSQRHPHREAECCEKAGEGCAENGFLGRISRARSGLTQRQGRKGIRVKEECVRKCRDFQCMPGTHCLHCTVRATHGWEDGSEGEQNAAAKDRQETRSLRPVGSKKGLHLMEDGKPVNTSNQGRQLILNIE